MTTTYDEHCQLCLAASEVAETENPDLKVIAKKHGVTMKQLKIRLGQTSVRTTWDEATLGRLQEMVDAGTAFADIAEAFGVKIPRLKQVITKHEINTARGETARRVRAAETAASEAESVLAVYRDEPNEWVSQIAVQAEVSEENTKKILTGLGLPFSEAPSADDTQDDDGVPAPEPEKTNLEWIKEYLTVNTFSSEEPASFEGFLAYASQRGGPTSRQVRKEFGTWANAKKTAEDSLVS